MSSNATESDGLLELMTWLEVNKKRLIIGAVTVGVVVGVLSIYNYQRKQREFAASDALVRLDAKHDARPSATDYTKVVEEYAGTQAAEQAVLLAAGAFFGEGRHNDAKAKFEEYLRDYPAGRMRGIAALGAAACLDEMNKLDEAIAAYQGVVSGYGSDPVVPRAKLAMAQLYETKKQPAQALKIYEELSRSTTMTSEGAEAGQLMEDLLKRHPELKPADAPRNAAAIPPAILQAVRAKQAQTTATGTSKTPAPANQKKP